MAYKELETGRQRNRECFRRRTDQRRAQGLCLRCGQSSPVPGRLLCERCAAKRRVAQRIRDAKRRATGKSRYTNPETERVRKRQRYQQQTAERQAQCLCPKCGKEKLPPDRRLCDPCGVKRRKAERARYAAGKAAGKLYGGKDPNLCRRIARERSKERFHARHDAGLCTRCGHRPLIAGTTTCEPCSDVRRAADRGQYGKRRAEGLCGRCGGPTDGGSRCGSCAIFEAGRHERKNAASRKRYARRRAKRLCTDCAQPSQGASRCPACAHRSYMRSGEHRGLPLYPAGYTVIEIATGQDHGTFQNWADVVTCLVFAGLSHDEVEVLSDVPIMATITSW